MTVFVDDAWATLTVGVPHFTATQLLIIDKITARNNGASPVDLYVYLVKNGGTLSDRCLHHGTTIAVGRSDLCLPIVGHDMAPGASIYFIAGAADVVAVRMSGRYK